MKLCFAVLLVLPALSFANEPAPAHSSEAKPATNATVHAPIKNAPPMQVDNLKPAKEGKLKTEAVAAGHEAAPAPAPVKAPAAPAAEHAAPPAEPPVVRYVPPKYGSSAPLVRQEVPSKAPRSHTSPVHAKKASHSSKTADMAVTPGIVRVLPSHSLPAGKVLPAGKMAADAGSSESAAATKPRLTWGETTVIKPAAAPAPEIYIVRDPELRWQQYSYP